MALDMSFLIADPDHYAPWDAADPGPRYAAGPLPAGWTRRDSGAWTHWGPADLLLPDQGWKVHVSSSLPNAQFVLGVVAAACAESGVPFKHLAGREMFLHAHGKHANRVQSGKFCTLYPPTEDRALRILRRLAEDLSGISGPFVLSDRRFGASECVSYRYGAFRGRVRVDAEGERVPVMLGPDGREIDDERGPAFHLPPGVVDPFRQADPDVATGPVTLHGYTFEAVVRHGNAGGAYRFRAADGGRVFLKEARAHNGYTPDGADAKARLTAEYLVLRAIHGREPGLCPRPVELFQHWEHSYLVSEFVPGMPLYRWMVLNNPAVRIGPDPAEFAEYHRRCLAIIDRLDAQLRRLHELGYVFVDLSPTNVLVDDDDHARLIDFEAVQPLEDVRRIMGTPGYLHPDPRSAVERDPLELDRFGLSALALLLLFPVHEAVERQPPLLDHLHADLSELAPVAPRLWRWATRCQDRTPDSRLPTPQAVREDTVAALRRLADRTADALEAMARPDHPESVYPTSPLGYRTDTRAVAAGTAGVLYALRRAGRGCDPAVVRRLRDDALAAADTSAPGLLYGSAGIACVLAELGEADAAGTLLAAAAAHPLNATSATLGGGAAGTALGLLIHHRRTGEQRWLDLAQRLLDRVPDGDELTARLSPVNRSGLVGGRTGVALALYGLYRRTGDPRYFARGMRLLQDELAYAEPLPVDGLGFKLSHADRRVYPYLFGGSAGYAAVLSRYLACRPDAEFDVTTGDDLGAADALERCLRACSVRFAVFPGLFPGLAGLAVTLAGAGERLGRPELIDAALTGARGLFRYAIPREDGVGWLGEPGQRLSADLWSGSAGILLALRRLTDSAPAPLDALDGHPAESRDAVAPASMERSGRHGRSSAVAG
ncbi:class III lanthionine synthetase LanKC [Actinoallomurus sp. NPDC052308]|uniref:class III lanthionine synthetase LanKC n=1 Tax=Actinoallomurus sp. NPDC052308 TaxID=3155530 RepID=UPI003426F6A1